MPKQGSMKKKLGSKPALTATLSTIDNQFKTEKEMRQTLVNYLSGFAGQNLTSNVVNVALSPVYTGIKYKKGAISVRVFFPQLNQVIKIELKS